MTFKSVTLEELSAVVRDLERFYDGETVVTFSSDYGDHVHTEQVHRLEGNWDIKPIQKSGYSESGYAVVDEEYVRPEKEYQKVLVIS